jgi:hypothetical protein
MSLEGKQYDKSRLAASELWNYCHCLCRRYGRQIPRGSCRESAGGEGEDERQEERKKIRYFETLSARGAWQQLELIT